MYDNNQKLKQESDNQYLNDTSILIRDEAKYLAEQVLGDETFKEINYKISFLMNESNKKDIEIKNISNILNNKYDFFLNKLEEKVAFFLDGNFTEKNETIDNFPKKDFSHLKIKKQNLDELSSKIFLKKLLIGFFEAKNIFFDILHSFFDINDLQQQDIRNELNNSVQEFKVFIDDVSIVVESLKTFEAKNYELIQKNEKDILNLFNKLDEKKEHKFSDNRDLISGEELNDFQDSRKYLIELNKVWEEQAIFFNKLDKLTQDKDVMSEKLNNLIEENNIKNNSAFTKKNITNDLAEELNSFSNDLLNIIQNQNLISKKFEELHKNQEEQNLKNENFSENIDLLSGTILNYFNKEKSNDDFTKDNSSTNIDNVIENDKFLQFIDNKLFNSIEKYEVLNSSFYDKVIDNISLLKKAIEEEFIFQKKLFFSEIEKINLFFKNKDADNSGIKVQNNSDPINRMGDAINSKNIDSIISSKMIEIVDNSISNVESKIIFLKKDIENILLNKNLNTDDKEVNSLENKIKNESLSKIFSEISRVQSHEDHSNKQEAEEIENDYKLLIENLRILNTIENLLKDQFLFQKNLTDEKKDSISKNINKINLLKENINEVKIQINKSSFSEILENSEIDLAKISKINEETYTLIQKSTMELVKNEINTYKLWENKSSYFDNKIKYLLEKLSYRNI